MTSSYNMSREFKSINIAILTVSDTRTNMTDKSGDFLSNAVVDAGHNVVHKRIVKDELVEIKNVLGDSPHFLNCKLSFSFTSISLAKKSDL